jgi:malonyl-CoA O-methyltransferase
MRELRGACAASALTAGFGKFPDLHDTGDSLVAAGFADPVMDSETIALDYGSIQDLLADLEGTGAAQHCTDWAAVRAAAETLRTHWPQGPGGRLALGWEIVYGVAFGPDEGQPVRRGGGEEATFSVEALRSGLRQR